MDEQMFCTRARLKEKRHQQKKFKSIHKTFSRIVFKNTFKKQHNLVLTRNMHIHQKKWRSAEESVTRDPFLTADI